MKDKIAIIKIILDMLENNCSSKEIANAISKLKPKDIKADLFGYKTKKLEFRCDTFNSQDIWAFSLSFEHDLREK